MALDAELPNVRGRIVQLYLRPSTAEGNPFHKALTREPYPPGAEVPLTSNGLEQSFEWHRDAQVISRGTLKRATDRAVLCQSVQHYSFLQQSFPQTRESLCGVAAFGENALIDGLDSSLLCIGDIFHVVRGSNADNVVATLQVSNPRRPCYKIDMKHRVKEPGVEGVRSLCARTGRAGWFFRVLEPGSLSAGDQLVLVRRLYPQWGLLRLSDLMYANTNAAYVIKQWRGTPEELDELIHLPELGIFEWQEVLIKYHEKRASGNLSCSGEAPPSDDEDDGGSNATATARVVSLDSPLRDADGPSALAAMTTYCSALTFIAPLAAIAVAAAWVLL